MKQKERYTLKELYDNLPITMTELSKLSGKSHGTLIRIRNGEPTRRSTINKLLIILSEIYKLDLSLENVTDVVLEERQEKAIEKAKNPLVKPAKQVVEKPPRRTYTRKKDIGLPDGCVLATDFARAHGIAPTTFRDHMLIGLGPVKEQVDYSERDHPSRKGETERYLTPTQQAAALDFWRRHGVAFTMPETEQEAKQEPAWYLPDQKS
jgi:transcriptional regulator with XRE-family HTH domain